MTTLVEVVADFVCPWCFIGKRRLDRALAGSVRRENYTVRWLPYELNPSISAAGCERLSYRTQRYGSLERSMQMDQRATLAGQDVGIAFRYDLMKRVPNTSNAHRLVWWAGTHAEQHDAVEAILGAYFLEGRDIGSKQTLLEIAEGLRLPRDEIATLFDDDRSLVEVRTLEHRVMRYGVATVPSYILNRADLVIQGLDSLISIIN
jgi:predicted DsbA family dithiol-disulfide isomerase